MVRITLDPHIFVNKTQETNSLSPCEEMLMNSPENRARGTKLGIWRVLQHKMRCQHTQTKRYGTVLTGLWIQIINDTPHPLLFVLSSGKIKTIWQMSGSPVANPIWGRSEQADDLGEEGTNHREEEKYAVEWQEQVCSPSICFTRVRTAPFGRMSPRWQNCQHMNSLIHYTATVSSIGTSVVHNKRSLSHSTRLEDRAWSSSILSQPHLAMNKSAHTVCWHTYNLRSETLDAWCDIAVTSMCQCEGLGAFFLIPNMPLLLQDDGCLTGKCAPAKSKGSRSLKQNTQLTNFEADRTLTHTREKWVVSMWLHTF